MNIPKIVITLFVMSLLLLTGAVLADINRVRVTNESDSTIYIHKGGYAPSVKILPKKMQIFYYPFYVVPPGQSDRIASSLLVATSGGRWLTTPNGFTYLSNPKMIICLDYKNPEHANKTGNRVWTIKMANGFDKDCTIKGYKQPWYQTPTPDQEKK